MVTVILPGYSVHNKEWLEETAQKINAEGEIRAIYWDHWTEPDKKLDPKEKARIIDDIAGVRMTDIIAKSIGTLVAAHMIVKSPDKIRKVIFCGIPLKDMAGDDKEVVKLAMKLISPDKMICIQNEYDPHGSFEQAKKFFSDIDSKIQVISKNRDDHEYFYQDEFKNFLLK
jgi:predicted alpha/beta hydrolase family esterase